MNKKYNELIEEVLSTSDFISKQIRHHIKLNIKKYDNFNYQKIQYILNFMENIYGTKFKGYLIIFPTDFKKELNNPPTKLGNNINTHNINGGVTIKYNDPSHKPIICIWRKEELERTLIHELIHYYNSNLLATKKVDKFVKSLNFNINYLGNAEELITELLTFFLCLKIRKSSEMKQEISHSFLNSVKILKHTGHPTFSSFFIKNPKNEIKTDTSLIYYYILKGFVLFFLNPKDIPSINKINKSYDDFLLKELKKITSPKYVKIIDDIMIGFKFDYDISLRHMFY